jgi:hypothetical protein
MNKPSAVGEFLKGYRHSGAESFCECATASAADMLGKSLVIIKLSADRNQWCFFTTFLRRPPQGVGKCLLVDARLEAHAAFVPLRADRRVLPPLVLINIFSVMR